MVVEIYCACTDENLLKVLVEFIFKYCSGTSNRSMLVSENAITSGKNWERGIIETVNIYISLEKLTHKKYFLIFSKANC